MAAATTVAAIAMAAGMLSWVALFNRAPLVFADSGGYAMAAVKGNIPGLFSIFYSALILPLHQGVTLWPVVLAQGAVLAHLLYLTTRCVSGGGISKPGYLAIAAALSVFSSLPWVSGQILPDALTAAVPLGLFLLGFCAERLSPAERIYLAVLVAVSIATHFSHVPIALGLIVLCFALRPLFAPTRSGLVSWALPMLIPFLVAVGTMLTVNWLDSRQIGLARNSNVFLLAKLIDEGPALSYLEEACPSAGYALCAQVEELRGKTHDDLKWGHGSPFHKIGSFDALEPEARRIVRATVLAHPAALMHNALRDIGRQLTRFAAGDGLTQDFVRLVAGQIVEVFGPAMEKSLLESRQGQGLLPIAEFRRLHTVALVLAAAFCLWSVIAHGRTLPRTLAGFYVFVAAGVLWNAVVTGALSGPYDRYLARVIWLVCLAGLLGFWHAVGADRSVPVHRPRARRARATSPSAGADARDP